VSLWLIVYILIY